MITSPDIKPDSIAFAATTYYPNWYPGVTKNPTDTEKVRGDLALQFCNVAGINGYRVVIADGASSSQFKQALSQTEAIVVQWPTPQRAAGKRLAIQTAANLEGVQVIIRPEAEKKGLVKHALTIATPIISGKMDVAVLRRKPALFEQFYPGYMHQSEVAGNREFNKLLVQFGLLPPDQELDILFGPNAFRNDPAIIKPFMEAYRFEGSKQSGFRKYINPEENCDGQILPVIRALAEGLRVGSIEIPFVYPVTQMENENHPSIVATFETKRKAQRGGLLGETIEYLRLLRNEQNPGLRNSRLVRITSG